MWLLLTYDPFSSQRAAHDLSTLTFQVLEAWKNLLEAAEGRRLKLVDTGDKFRFFSMVRDLMLWMEDVIRLIEAQENPRSAPRSRSRRSPNWIVPKVTFQIFNQSSSSVV